MSGLWHNTEMILGFCCQHKWQNIYFAFLKPCGWTLSAPIIIPLLSFDPGVDTLVELSIHKVALKPVSSHLYSCIETSRTNDGTFERLQSNLRLLEKNEVTELGGSAGVGVPDSVTLDRIQQKWNNMHDVYSPNKKVEIMLKVCKSIYHSMSANASSGSLAVFRKYHSSTLSRLVVIST